MVVDGEEGVGGDGGLRLGRDETLVLWEVLPSRRMLDGVGGVTGFVRFKERIHEFAVDASQDLLVGLVYLNYSSSEL